MAQAIAGADMALWDLVGQRLQQPLWRLLGGTDRVETYASGLSPTQPEKLAAAKRDEGFRAFKLKVGFGVERDLANLRALRDLLVSRGQDFASFLLGYPTGGTMSRMACGSLEPRP